MQRTYSLARQNKADLAEILYFAGLILYLLLYLSYETQWVYPGKIMVLLRPTSMLCLVVSTVSSISNYKSAKELYLFFAVFLVSLIVGYNAGFRKNSNLLYVTSITFCLVFGAKGIDYKKIVKVYLIVGGSFCLLTICASLLGLIKNYVDIDNRTDMMLYTSSTFQRWCFGYNWSTNMANHVFFILLCYFVYINRSFKVAEYLSIAGISCLLLYYTGSRLSAYLIFLLLLFSLLLKSKTIQKLFSNRVATIIFIIIIPFFTLISYFVTSFYDYSNIHWLLVNSILSGRLGFGNDALNAVGLSIFGQSYIMFGSAREDGKLYNFIDSTYIQLLVIYGIVYTILFVSAYAYINYKASKRKDNVLMVAILLAGLSGFIAQHFLELYMCPFIIALFAKHRREIYSISKIHERVS